jgi:trk system potassium uptake protein TrkA
MNRFAVIGLGRFGSRLASNLAAAGAEVIAIDSNRQIVEDLRDKVTLAIALDATDEQALKIQGVDQVDCAVVGIGQDFEANALATALLKSLGIDRVVSRAGNQMQAEILTRIGADGVVRPEDESAERWTHRLLAPTTIDHIELGDGYALVQRTPPATWIGKALSELDLRKEYRITVVAIRRATAGSNGKGARTERTVETPMPGSRLDATDILVIAGFDRDLEKLPE